MRSATLRTDLRFELEQPLPGAMDSLPVRRGYPVPWFVEWVEDGKPVSIGRGEPDFRIMSSERFVVTLREPICWVCGSRMGAYRSFTVGPMCTVNRTSAEPPSHRSCAEWSARNCPFLSRPNMKRREAGLPEELKGDGKMAAVAGIALLRNPGVEAVWTTRRYGIFDDGSGGVLFDIGDPDSVTWWAEGREATRGEVEASIELGLPSLLEMAEDEGSRAVRDLERMVKRARTFLPAEGS